MARGKRPKRGSRGGRRGRRTVVIIREKAPSVAKLTVKGPTTPDEGADLAAKLNAVIAEFNSRFFLKNGVWILPKITANTAQPS